MERVGKKSSDPKELAARLRELEAAHHDELQGRPRKLVEATGKYPAGTD